MTVAGEIGNRTAAERAVAAVLIGRYAATVNEIVFATSLYGPDVRAILARWQLIGKVNCLSAGGAATTTLWWFTP